MNVKLGVLTAGALFFLGSQSILAQQKDTLKVSDIEEVVVVGFGQKKTVQEMTGSASTMKSDQIKEVPVASVDKMLQGRVAGVQTGSSSGQPGGMASVRVRGISSINGVVSPIYVVDGVRVASGDLTTGNTTANILASMNPDDIENVTVLKDAVSTAVYGADAGAGVIIITTKSGRKGQAKFNLSMNTGVNERAVEGHKAFNITQWREYLAQAVMNTYNATPSWGQTFTNITEVYDFLKAGGEGADLQNIFTTTNDTDWRRETQKTGYQQNVDFNVSGGNDKLTYYSSANYFSQESIVKSSGFSRLAFTSKIGYQATDKLKITTDFQISHANLKTLSEGGAFSNPILAQYFNRPSDATRNPDGTFYWNPSNSRLSNGLYNIPYLQENNYAKGGTVRGYANLGVEYKILKDLTYKFVFSPEYINIEESTYWNPLHGDGYTYGGYQRTSNNRYFNFNVQNILDWNHKYGMHNLGATLIQEAYKTDNKFISATGITVGTPTLQTLSNFIVPYGYSGTAVNTSRYGYAVTGHYDYNRLILVDGSFRRDVLSQFVPEKKAGNFWSLGLGLDLAKTSFVRNVDMISQMKFRASYGKLGNQVSANPYALYSYTSNYNDYAAAGYSGLYNPNLSWETVNPLNVGVDLGFWNNRLTLSAEYFNKKTKDLIYNLPLSGSQGLTSYVDNIGSLVNEGLEFTLNADIFRGDRDQFTWDLGFNLSTLDNKITELYGGDVNTGTTTIRVGESVRTWYLKKWAGVDPANGDPLWYKDGIGGETTNDYASAKQAVQGSMLSNLYGGLNTTMGYKGFALDLQFTYGFGGKILDDWATYLYSDGYYSDYYPGYADVMGDYWTPENRTASNPKPMYYYGNKNSYRISDRVLYDSDFIRLSNAKFSYSFKNSLLNGTGLTGAQIYVMANNAWTHVFDDRLKFDPEINVAGSSNLGLPILKTFLLGVNLSF
ncbi:SusC/RagA family TonB-linked outer membrane protein [Chryseobacterium sp. H3056]|uniref:SusC/RagA family TonB-linked outer membrane protein n=1 Tax=Kaistella daneshvariae TaxID=2487074 RepID=A0A3N0WRD6_9FLAO|nr:SusC/RagA family TonB-linked outer membrane protein [Kaistella daneshvariae]ROI07676.1 SusC/RagA family TonB-linked outer membrane protein [Kaistella daneshvariae]